MKKQLLILSSILAFATSSQAQLSFAPAVNYGAGTNPNSVFSSDFNGDGKMDLAIANYNSNNVSVLLGSGSGTFAPAVNYPVGSLPSSIFSADFNNDGNMDLATANSGGGNVSVLLGSGTGTFAVAVNYVDFSASSIFSADFNGDGNMDIVTANNTVNHVSVLLGSGTGTFAPEVNYAVSGTPRSVFSADFNGDGNMDLVTANSGAGDVSVLLGSGTGTFAPEVNYGVGTSPNFVFSADFNGDGNMDLATANTFGTSSVSVLLGSGTGTFAAAVNYTVGLNPISLFSDDFNSDGKMDLVAANFGSNNVSALLGSGTGTFATAINYAVGTTPRSVFSADLNGDGKKDLVTANYNSNNVSVLLNTSPVPGEALNFVGTNTVSIGNSLNTTLSSSNKVTVEAWVKPSTTAGLGCIAGNYNTATANMQFLLRRDGANFAFYADKGTGFVSVVSAATATVNAWQHVAGTWDGSVMRIYVNGVLSNTTALVGTNLIANANPIYLGANNISENFSGSIDEVRIWNRALCQSEIQNNMAGEIATTGNSLLANYHFNQGVAAASNAGLTSLIDASASALTGTLTGFALTGATSNWIAPGGVVTGSIVPTFTPSVHTTTLSQTNVLCNGASTGSATITASGATSPYTYLWSTGATTSVITGQTAGVRTVTVTNACGGITVNTITITQPTAITLNPNSQTNIACFGGNTGAASVSAASGGAGSYTYNWTPGNPTGDGTTSVTGLTTGTWTCTVTDANSCTTAQTFNITQPTAITLNPASQTNIACFGGNTGAASVSAASGGAGSYTYNWTPGNPTGDGTTSVTGLTTGTWTCTVTDANSCTTAQTFNITQPTAITLNPNSQTNIACFGGNTGAASVIAASGGAGSYTYNWTPGNPTGDGTTSVTGLTAGTWTCTVTDVNSCTTAQTFSITQPTAITLNPNSQTNIACFGGNSGAASVSAASGGAGSYTYNWTPGNPTGDGTTSVTGLAAGTWTCAVTDVNSCTTSQTFNITQPTALTTSTAVTDVLCNGGIGSATITASGGTGSYAYLWSTGATTSVIASQLAGVYTATVTDANSCTSVKSMSVSEPSLLNASATASSGTICTSSSSTLTANASGGAGVITYSWIAGPTNNVYLVTPSSTTIFTVNVTDANNCSTTSTVEVVVNSCAVAEALNFDGVNDGVNVPMNGSLQFGTGDFTLESWINTTNASTKVILGSVGSGESYWLGTSVNKATVSVSGVSCNGVSNLDDGVWHHIAGVRKSGILYIYVDGILENSISSSLQANPTSVLGIGYFGGSGFFFTGALDEVRIWNIARTQCEINMYKSCEIPTTMTGLLANYNFNQGLNGGSNTGVTTLIDASGGLNNGTLANFALTGATSNWVAPGGVVSGSITPASLTPTITVNSGAICAGQSFTMIPSGAMTYSYSSGTGVVAPTSDATYSVSGTDANGCVSNIDAVSSVTVNVLPTLMVMTTNTLLCTGETATLSVGGASTYTWSTTENTTDIAVTPTVQTTYTVDGTDSNGCSNTTTITQDVSLCTGIASLSNSDTSIKVYPNPNNGLFVLELTSSSKVTVTNALGQIVISETFEFGKHNLDIHNEATGVYFVKVIENNRQQLIKIIKH